MPAPSPLRRGAAAGLVTAALVASAGCGAGSEPGGGTGPDPSAPSATSTPATSTPTGRNAGAPGPRSYPRYVALGDSFSALGTAALPTSGPPTCERAPDAYPAVLDTDPRVGRLAAATCGGARTSDLTAPQADGVPPQFDALAADTELVTLSIGGNDIGFGDIVRCVVGTGRSTGAPCRDRLGPTVDAAVLALGTALDRVHAGIRERSPAARVVVTGYLPLVPASGGCAFTDRMGPGDVAWTREVTDRVNAETRSAADRAGAAFVLPAAADDHSACAPAPRRWTDFTGSETGAHPMHPTAAGHLAMAAAVAAVL